jgi:tetratricopeptide (TPR) repeat protein
MELLADTETIPSALLPRVVSHLSALSQKHPSDGLLLFDLTMARSGVWSGNKFKATAELVTDLHRALVLSPDMPRAYLALAAVYDEQKRIPEEIRTLQHALALAPEEAKIHYRLAFAYRESGDQQRFEQELRAYQALHAEQLVAK